MSIDSEHTCLNATMNLLIFWSLVNVNSHISTGMYSKKKFYNCDILFIESVDGFSNSLPRHVNIPPTPKVRSNKLGAIN